MKKTILTAAIAISALLGITGAASAAIVSQTEVSTMVPNVSRISQLEVHGNVKVYLTTGNEDRVKVYDNYYANDALVQEQNGVLRITSYNADQLVVWVTVSDLSKLSVFDNAEVATFNKFSTIDLVVNIHDKASAQLDMDASDAVIALHDCAKADVSGTIENATLFHARSASLNTTNLEAANLKDMVKPGRRMMHPHPVEFASL